MNVQCVFNHSLLHFGRGVHELHEVDRFHATAKSRTQPIGAAFGQQFAGHTILGDLMSQRWNGVGFHPNEWRVV